MKSIEAQDFENFIKSNHPDPDFAMREFNQMTILASEFAKQAVNSKLEESLKIINELEPYNPDHIEPDSQLDQFDVGMINKRWDKFQNIKESINSLKL